MRKIYQFYIVNQFIIGLLMSTMFFVVFLLMFELFRILQFANSPELSMAFFLKFLGQVSITLVPMAIPIGAYFSSIYVTNKLVNDSEYIAMRAMGLSKFNLFKPLIIVGIMASMTLFYFYNYIVPGSHLEVRRMINIISSSSLTEGIKSGQFFTRIPGVTLFTEKVDEKTKELESIFLNIVDENKIYERIIMGEKGQIIHEKDETTGLETFRLLVKNGNLVERDRGKNETRRFIFSEYELPISKQRFNYQPDLKEIMMNFNEINTFIDEGLDRAIERGFKKKDYFNAKYERLNRVASAILVAILCLLGHALSVKSNRSHNKGGAGKSIAVLIIYFAVFFFFVSQAREGKIPIYLGVFLPIMLLSLYTAKQVRKLDWSG